MAQRYDARGNIYIVVAPEELRHQGIDLPDQASHAAQTRQAWAFTRQRSLSAQGSPRQVRHAFTGADFGESR